MRPKPARPLTQSHAAWAGDSLPKSFKEPLSCVSGDLCLARDGRLDYLVPAQQSIIFAEQLAKHVGHDSFEFEILEAADLDDPGFETEENMDRVFAFLDRHLKLA